MDTYKRSQEMSQQVLQTMESYAAMIGQADPKKKGADGYYPGLDMLQDARSLREQTSKLKEGVFQVLFTGGFSCGKSTLLNALMRKDVLRTAITAETSVITKVIFRQQERVIIRKKQIDSRTGRNLEEQMDVETFFEKFRVDQKHPEKFDEIEYVTLFQPQEGIGGNLVQLVDSPGTENSPSDTKAARNFAKSANAIVHMINATTPFVDGDKNYIRDNYANRHMENLFFVINRIDCVTPSSEVERLKQNVRLQLHDVFLDKNGRFNEELFARRVFYTNAYGSLMSRLGQPIKVFGVGDVMIDDNLTGVPAFEEALGRFLTDDDRDRTAFQGYLPRISAMYATAETKVQNLLSNYRKGVEVLEQEKARFDQSEHEYAAIVDGITESCRTAVQGIVTDIGREFDSCLNRINTGWDAHFDKVEVSFGFMDMMGLAWDCVINKFSDDDIAKNEKLKKKMEPFADEVKKYIEGEYEKSSTAMRNVVESHITRLGKQLSLYEQQANAIDSPVSFDEVKQNLIAQIKFKGGMPQGNASDGNLVQIILGLVGLDPEMIAAGANGTDSTGKAIFDFLYKNVFEFIALCIVGWPIGLGMLAVRLVQMIRGANQARVNRVHDIFAGMRKGTVAAIQESKEKCLMNTESEMGALTRAANVMSASVQKQLDEYRTSLQSTISNLQQNQETLSSEQSRTDRILNALQQAISNMSKALGGSSLSRDEILKLAAK